MPSQPPKWIEVIWPVLLGVNLLIEGVAFSMMVSAANSVPLPVVSIVGFLFFFLLPCVLYIVLITLLTMYPQ